MTTAPESTEDQRTDQEAGGDDFESQAELGNAGLLREIVDLILDNKKWWLVPVLIVLLVIGLLSVLMTSAVAPFLYPFF